MNLNIKYGIKVLVIMKKYLVILFGFFIFSQSNLFAGNLFSNCRKTLKETLNENLSIQLIWAAKHNNINRVKRLIKAGADVNIQNINEDTALIWASREGHAEIVRLLIEGGADINIQNNEGETALMVASFYNRTEIVKELIEADANVNIKNKYGNTALIFASKHDHTEIVKGLINAGADVNMQNYYGNTALIWASKRGYIQLEKLLKAVIEVEKGINKFKDQSKEAKSILIQRWINLKDNKRLSKIIFEKLELDLPEFYKKYLEIYRDILSGNISKEEMKKILTGKAELSKLAKTNKIYKSTYSNLHKKLLKLYELSKVFPKELTTEIGKYI